jgi:ATP-binding cassette subfamily B multidrug efflux pump
VDYIQADEVEGKAYDSRLMRRILHYLAPYRRTVVLSVVLLAIVSVAQLAPPYLTKVAIDRYLTPSAEVSNAVRYAGLWKIIGVFAFALVVGFVVSYIQNYTMSYVGQRVMFDLRVHLFGHIQRMEVQFFDKNPVGRLMTRLTSDVEVLNELFTSGVVAIFLDVFTLAGIVAILCYLNLKLALITFMVLPLLGVATHMFRVRARDSYRKVRVRLAALNSFLQENVTGMSVVQLFNRERAQLDKFNALNRDLYDAHIMSVVAYAMFFPAIELLSAVAIALILAYGGGDVIRGAMTFGSLVAFIQYAQRFYRPIADLSEKYNILQSAMASSRIQDPPVPRALPRPTTAAAPSEVVFEDVRFSYNPGEPVLHGVSFRVAPGEKVAVVGYTGAGKTTIINLLSRFYEVDSGRILINGVDIRDLTLSDLRRDVAVVLQDVFLFSGSVAENITLGNPAISGEKMREVSRYINAEKLISKLPHGYAENVGERGKSLSVGERQLLSFARALVYDPMLLVLDEATSSVDTETEYLVQDALKKFMSGRTAIVIAHRLSTIRDVDRIVVLHKGRIVEEGPHHELLAKGGLYSELYELQFKDQEKNVY